MAQLPSTLAYRTTIAKFDLTNPILATLIKKALAPEDALLLAIPHHLFNILTPSSTNNTASPSIRRYLTTTQQSSGPTFCGALNFLDNQLKCTDMLPPNDHMPVGPLHILSEPASTVGCENLATHTMNLFTTKCHLIIQPCEILGLHWTPYFLPLPISK